MGTTQPWRWTALTSGAGAAAGQPQVSCGSSAVTQHQAAVAAQAASLHAGTAAAPGNHHVATQPGLNYPAQVVWPCIQQICSSKGTSDNRLQRLQCLVRRLSQKCSPLCLSQPISSLDWVRCITYFLGWKFWIYPSTRNIPLHSISILHRAAAPR